MDSKERNEIPSRYFAIPERKAFPLNDKEHVLRAIRMFHYAKPVDRVRVAKAIIARGRTLKVEFPKSKNMRVIRLYANNKMSEAMFKKLNEIMIYPFGGK